MGMGGMIVGLRRLDQHNMGTEVSPLAAIPTKGILGSSLLSFIWSNGIGEGKGEGGEKIESGCVAEVGMK